MDVRCGKFSSCLKHHPEDLCQTPTPKIESARPFNKTQSATEEIPYEVALLAESYWAWHCLDPLFIVHVQVNSPSRMGIGYHAGYRSPRINDEIQIIASIDETKGLQIPYESRSVNCSHLDPAHWALDCRLIGEPSGKVCSEIKPINE